MVCEEIEKIGLIPIAVFGGNDDVISAAEALIAGGLPIVEVTFRTDFALESVKMIKKKFPGMIVGAGTIRSIRQVRSAVEVGADFIVTPGFDEEIVRFCNENRILVIPGCVTPSEISRAQKMGIKIVKFFPATVYGGICGCQALNGPFADIKFLPTGGVNMLNLGEYVNKDYIFAVGGGWLCSKELVERKAWEEIIRRAKESIDILLGTELLDMTGERRRKVSFFDVVNGKFHEGVREITIFTYSVKRALFYLNRQGFAIQLERKDRVILESDLGLKINLMK